MRILSILSFLVVCLSCSRSSEDINPNRQAKDSISIYYEWALRDDFPTSLKRNYINRSLELSKQEDTLRSSILYSKSNIHLELKEYDSLYFFGKKLTAHATRKGDYLSLGKYAHLMAYYHENITQNIDSAFFYHNLSKNQYLKIPDSLRAIRRIIRIAVLQNIRNDFFGAKETLVEALDYVNLKEDKENVAYLYNELGSNHRKLLNYADAITYFKLAINTSDSKNDIIGYKNNLSAAYIENRQLDLSIRLLQELIKSPLLKKESALYARVLDNLTYAKWLNGHKIIREDFHTALKIRKKKNDRRGQIASYTHLGEYYSIPNPSLAKMYFDTVIQISKQLKIPKAETDALKLLMTLEPDKTIFKDRYIFLRDSMYQQELKVKTQFAKMKYDDEKEKERILRLERETAQKQASLTQEKAQKAIYLSLSGLLIFAGAFFYYIIRARHKKEKLQEIYTTEKRISKKVHDELANDIYGVMTNVEHSTTFQKEAVLNTLDDIYRRTRDISHRTGAVDTQNYEEELKKLLSQFRNDNTVITVRGLNNVYWNGISNEKKIIVYRILNEFLVNMKKHSGASLVSISFEKRNRELRIDYFDNGVGAKMPFKKGVGLTNTETRIKNIDGTFSFDCEQGKGVRISCAFPI